MSFNDAFSTDYHSARAHFRKLSQQLTDNLTAYSVASSNDDLSIDVAVLGDVQARRSVIISSGLHGVEGFVGSAIQIALLDGLINHDIHLADCSVMLIHAINPYGFKYLRRVNENNIDLNRNFLDDFNAKPGAMNYAKFNNLLNPCFKNSGFDVFTLKAYLYICRYGIASLRESISAGQYDFPLGLFFGGESAAQSTKVVKQILPGDSTMEKKIFHVDIHSGLGRYADYKLLLSGHDRLAETDSYASMFDSEKMEVIGGHGGITSAISGTISEYFSLIMGKNYHHLGLEIGTYSNLRLLKTMRLENAAHQYLDESDSRKKKIKSEFLECFCPADPNWRNAVIGHGLTVINQALIG